MIEILYILSIIISIDIYIYIYIYIVHHIRYNSFGFLLIFYLLWNALILYQNYFPQHDWYIKDKNNNTKNQNYCTLLEILHLNCTIIVEYITIIYTIYNQHLFYIYLSDIRKITIIYIPMVCSWYIHNTLTQLYILCNISRLKNYYRFILVGHLY